MPQLVPRLKTKRQTFSLAFSPLLPTIMISNLRITLVRARITLSRHKVQILPQLLLLLYLPTAPSFDPRALDCS